MIKGWLVVNGVSSGASEFAKHIESFIESFSRVSIRLEVKTNDELVYEVSAGEVFSLPSKFSVVKNGIPVAPEREVSAPSLNSRRMIDGGEAPEFALFWDRDVNLARNLENDFPVFNSAACIEACGDKALTHHYLALEKVPCPRIIFAPKYNKTEDLPPEKFIDAVIDRLGLPIVVKECGNPLGDGAKLAKTKTEIYDAIIKADGRQCLFQEYIKHSHGRDMKVYIAGGAVVHAVLRENQSGDFRADGAESDVSEVSLSDIETEIALKAAAATGATFCAVNMLFDEAGFPLVYGVDSNAQFTDLKRAMGFDFSRHIAILIKKILTEYK